MLHLRLIVPGDTATVVVAELTAHPAVAHVVHLPGVASSPAGDAVFCDVAREAADGIVEWLQRLDVHRRGAIALSVPDTVVSDAAARAEAAAPGDGGDAVIWEQIEYRARREAVLTVSFAAFMALAATIAAIGVLLDSPILIVGAMVVGPEYGPLASLCVSAVRRRRRPAVQAAATVLAGFALAGFGAFLATLLLRVTNAAPDGYSLTDRQLTAFISHPDALAAVVAVLAGIVGMLAVTQSRSGALIGVFVSVTTIPAVGAASVAAAYGEWGEVGGSLAQLGINVAGLAIAGVATLVVQDRLTASDRRRG